MLRYAVLATLLGSAPLAAQEVPSVPAPAITPATGPADASPPVPVATPRPATIGVTLTTSLGPIVLELEKERAPITTANFLRYVDARKLDGTTFYRALRLGPDAAWIAAERGRNLRSLGEHEQAMVAFDRAVEFAHSVLYAHHGEGRDLNRVETYAPLLAAIGLPPDLPDIHDPQLWEAVWEQGRRIGLRSFPTLAVVKNGAAHVLPPEYDPERLSALVAKAAK